MRTKVGSIVQNSDRLTVLWKVPVNIVVSFLIVIFVFSMFVYELLLEINMVD